MCENSDLNCIETSVIIPVLNEEKNIDRLLDTICQQTYSQDKYEIIFVDGGSTDKTIECINKHNEFSNIRIIDNPKKTAQHAMNIGIDVARGKYIIRLDAHSFYCDNYFEELINSLNSNSEIGNVGGICLVEGDNTIGKAYARVLSTFFGVGSSDFRISNEEKYVNTVPFGAFRKEEIIKIGKYDDRLERNEDLELNLRYIRNGYKILLKPSLIITYKCRDTIKSIIKHELSDGIWNSISLKYCPYTFTLAHFIPMIFDIGLLGVIFSFVFNMKFFKIVGIIGLMFYLILDIIFSIKNMKYGVKEGLLSFILYPLHHISYGVGEIIGLFQ